MSKEYSTFIDVVNNDLRAWNRCAMAFNIAADDGLDKMRSYVRQFSQPDRVDIGNMYARIKTYGYEKTKAAVSRMVQNEPRPDEDAQVA